MQNLYREATLPLCKCKRRSGGVKQKCRIILPKMPSSRHVDENADYAGFVERKPKTLLTQSCFGLSTGGWLFRRFALGYDAGENDFFAGFHPLCRINIGRC